MESRHFAIQSFLFASSPLPEFLPLAISPNFYRAGIDLQKRHCLFSTQSIAVMTLTQSIIRTALATALLLLIPLVAMQFTQEVVWTLSDFVFVGVLLFGVGLAFVLIARLGDNTTYRVAVGVAVALIVAFVARFRPLGMANAMFAAALTYVLVTAIALFIWQPAGAAAEPNVHSVNGLVANGVFAATWAVSGLLFRRASVTGSTPGRQLA